MLSGNLLINFYAKTTAVIDMGGPPSNAVNYLMVTFNGHPKPLLIKVINIYTPYIII